MSEPYWSALGGGVVDYEGAWAAGTQYAPGDVVRHNGVDFLAVNPSLGVDPGAAVAGTLAPLVTALPASPADGQEIILVDSLTAPTYQWRFRYMAAKASNKWVYVGGAPRLSGPQGDVTLQNAAPQPLTGGPSINVPVAGRYILDSGCRANIQATALTSMRHLSYGSVTGLGFSFYQVTAGQYQGAQLYGTEMRDLVVETLTIRISADNASTSFTAGILKLTPLAVGG